jgi:peptidoglycan/LPS O-acetylase OafA/YrhL
MLYVVNMLPAVRRYPTLDLLRLVALGLTILTHTPGVVRRVFFLRPFERGTWLGVDLFMLISGWLLGGQLLREAAGGTFDAPRFYFKRWLRTLPAYYVMLALLYFGGDPDFGRPLPWRTILTHMAFLQLYLPPNLYGVSWSLCVEEHFYLLLPAVVWLLMRRPKLGTVLTLVIVFETIAILGRLSNPNGYGGTPQQTHLRCHGLFIGLLLAWINLHRQDYWLRLKKFTIPFAILGLVSILAVMASVPAVGTVWSYVCVPTVGTWALALIFIACVHELCPLAHISFPGLQYLGELTYSVYLVHHVIPRAWLGAHAETAGLSSLARRLVLMVVLSLLLHHLVERPGLKLRARILRRQRPAPEPA